MSEGRELAQGGGANRWKYQSFQDRIKHVRIDVTQSAIALRHEEEDLESFFVGALQQWQELNCTAEFSAFVRDINRYAQSLALVLYHKQEIVEAIIRHLGVMSTNAYEPILNLTTMLAKDLRQEIFESLGPIVRAILPLLRVRDASVIEHAFQCIAYLLRYLQGNVLREMPAVFDMLSPLLGRGAEYKPFIRQFAAESVSYMIRQTQKDKARVRSVVTHIMETADAEGNRTGATYAESLGHMFAETMIHVNYTTHSCTSVLLQNLLDCAIEAPSERRDFVMAAAFQRLMQRTNKDTNATVLKLMAAAWPRDVDRLSRYYLPCIALRNGDRIPSWSAMLATFSSVAVPHETVSMATMELFAQLLLHASYEDVIKNVSTLERTINHPGLTVDVQLHFHRCLLRGKFESYNSLVLPLTVKFLTARWASLDLSLVVGFLAEVLGSTPLLHSAASSCVSKDNKLIFDPAFPTLSIIADYKPASGDRRLVVAAVSAARKLALPAKKLQAALVTLLGKTADDTFLFSHTLQTLLALRLMNAAAVAHVEAVELRECPYLAASVAEFITLTDSLTPEKRTVWSAKLVPFVSSMQHSLREPVIRALAFLQPNEPLLDTCFSIESTPCTMDTHRSKAMHLKNLGLAISKNTSAHVAEVVSRLALALYAVNYAPLWPPVTGLIAKAIAAFPDAFWAQYTALLPKFQNRDSFPEVVTKFAPLETLEPTAGEIMLQEFAESVFTIQAERIDYWNIYIQAVKALSGTQLAEAKTKFFVPMFLQFVQYEYRHYHDDLPALDEECVTDLPFEHGHALSLTHVIVTKKLTTFLELLSHYKPSQVHKSAILYDLYLALLLRGDAVLQKASLMCINTYGRDWYKPYHALMLRLVEDGSFRETMLSIKIDGHETPTFRPEHRGSIFQILTRLLYGRMMSRKSHMAARRGNVLSLMAAATDDEIRFLFGLMVPCSLPAGTVDLDILDRVDVRKTAGFLNLMDDTIKQINRRLVCVLGPMFDLLTSIACATHRTIVEREASAMDVDGAGSEQKPEADHDHDDADRDDEDDAADAAEHGGLSLKRLYKMRTLSIRRLITLFDLDIKYDYSVYAGSVFEHLVRPRLANLVHENKTSVSPGMQFLSSWAVNHFEVFQPIATEVLPAMVACLPGFEPVRSRVLDTLFSVLDKEAPLLVDISSQLFDVSAKLVHPKSVGAMSRLIKLCSEMAPLIRPEEAPMLVTVLLPVVTSSKSSPETKDSILVILQSCIPHLPVEDVRTVLLTVSRLFPVLVVRESRQQLVKLVQTVADALDLSSVGHVVRGLNQYSTRRIDDLDYDVVLATFMNLGKRCGELAYLEWVPILYNLFHLIKDEDMSARGNASHVMCMFVQQAKDKVELRPLVQHVVYPAFKASLKGSLPEMVRIEWIKVLIECVKSLDMEPFSDMTRLLPQDASDESSFFENVYHIQLHRRQRALVRLRDHVPHLRPATLNYVLLPIVSRALDSKDPNVATEAIATITAITRNLPWASYYLALRNFFSQLRAQPEKRREKVLLRAVVAVLDGFHFEIADAPTTNPAEMEVAAADGEAAAPAAAAAAAEAEADEEEDEDTTATEAQVEEEDAEDRAAASTELSLARFKWKVLRTVTLKIIPEMLKYLTARKATDEDHISVRVPIALGVTYLITWLPEANKNLEIPSLLTKLSQLMRSRAQPTRNVTRDTLAKIMTTLGAKYLFFMIKELKGALLRGYQLHVLGFTVHTILSTVPLTMGALEACADDLCEILSNDVFGDVGDEKDAEAYIKAMKELKGCMSFDTIEIVCRTASLRVISKLLVQVKRVLVNTREASLLDKAHRVLKRMTHSVIANQGLEIEQLMKLVNSLIVDTFAIANSNDVDEDAIATAQTQTQRVQAATTQWKANAHYFVEFGLHLLQTILRSPRLDVKNPIHTQMLNAMVDAVGQCFSAKHNNTFVLATYAMQYLAKLPLSELRGTLPAVMSDVFAMLSNLQNARSDIGHACLKLILGIMHSCDYIPFTQAQVKLLIRLLRPEIHDHDNHTITYSLIKGILSRRVVVNEVYELILDIAHIMVTSQTQAVQDLCRSVYLQFLLNYPQGKKRMENHITWMVKNLGYEYEQGRTSVLELMHSFIRKLPADLTAEYGEIMFMGLVSCLTDDAPKCQAMAAKVIQVLLARMTQLAQVNKMVASWYKNAATKLVAVQLHGLLILAGRGVPEHLPLLADLFRECAERAAAELEASGEEETLELVDGDESHLDSNTEWKLLYLSILTLTKHITAHPEQSDIDLVATLSPHLSHPHTWVRLASSRCIGLHFASSPTLDLGVARNLAREFTRQLASEFLNDELATQVVKNLFFIAKQIHAQGSSAAAEDDDEAAAAESDNDAEAGAAPKDKKRGTASAPLYSFVQHLSFLARKDQARNTGTLFRKSIFQVFAAVANAFDVDTVQPLLHPIMAPLFRTIQDTSVKGEAWDELRTFCQQIMELLQEKLGNAAFTAAYADVRQRAESKRQSRKQDRAEMAVVNPQQYAKRKIARNELKKKQKKRRAEDEMASRVRTSVKRAKTTH
ncbi:U3 snoRNP protein [Blastocladiella emersonii ATCC 22665]|nr:U3 snoRNP protein [Blastocladiella emersonii ATCC 22665]